MNKQLQKIAKQAGGHNNITKTCGQCPPDYIDPATVDLEKFAELIVRECAAVADKGYASDNFGNGITGTQLLKLFGLEKWEPLTCLK